MPSPATPVTIASPALAATPLAAVLRWLETPAAETEAATAPPASYYGSALAELPQLLPTILTTPGLRPEQRRELLELLHLRTRQLLAPLFARLAAITLPAAPALRQTVADAQSGLAALASASEAHPDQPTALTDGARCRQWHLELSAAIAAPPAPGIWLGLHQLYRQSRRLGLPLLPYLAAQLLACTQPAALSPPELALLRQVIARLLRQSCLPGTPPNPDAGHRGLYWIAPLRDEAATAQTRRPAPAESDLLWLTCDPLAAALIPWIEALQQGQSPASLGLPPFAASPAGLATLHCAVRSWSTPPRRTHPRRRQSQRASLIIGLDAIRQTLSGNPAGSAPPGSGTWMIINDSPDGCGVMHLAGPTGQPASGEPALLRLHPAAGSRHASDSTGWQLCIVRWTLSENPAHLELGLQRLASDPCAATLVRELAGSDTPERLPVLSFTLPPHQRPALLTATGALPPGPVEHAVLLQHSPQQLGVSDILLGPALEQNARSEWRAWRHQPH